MNGRLLAVMAVACSAVVSDARALAAQDSLAVRAAARTAAIQRAQRLVNDGSGSEGRAVVDSLLNATEPRSPEEAEILFWRATLAESWDHAQRDYLRVMLEHDTSPFAAQAMLRLAQGEMARGDRDAALRYLERLVVEAPESAVRPEAALWQGRLLMDRGARVQGCAVLRAQRPRVAPGALELERQYDYLLGSCPTAPTESISAATPPSDSAPPPAPTGPALVWSVQIAAFQTADEAAAFAAEMREKGYETRVDGSAPPYRIRFGRFATRAAAAAAMEAYRRAERADAFLTQVPRG